MATRFPQPVKDLPGLEPDSDDDFETPGKHDDNAEFSSELDIFGNIKIPRKVAELSPLESDSDDDLKSNGLNCAILNDSFILSPTRSLDCETPIGKQKNEAEKMPLPTTIDNIQVPKIVLNDSFTDDFVRLELNNKENSTKSRTSEPKSRHALFPATKSAAKTTEGEFSKPNLLLFGQTKRNLLLSSATDKPNIQATPRSIAESLSTAQNENTIRDLFPIPDNKLSVNNNLKQLLKNKPDILEAVAQQSNHCRELITPFKSSIDPNFQTPQIKSYQLPFSRRPNLPSSTNTNLKSRSALENEFRSPKILFRTPVAVSRGAALINNNITLSFDDSIKEKQKRGEKSLESIAEKLDDAKPVENVAKDVVTSEVNSASNRNEVDKLIVINGNEYVLVRKLGSGGSSSVFLARRMHDGKECALKIVDLRGDKSVVEGYLNETRLLAKLQGNVNIVSLYEYQHLSNEFTLYMVMEKGDSDLNKILQSYKTNLPLYVLISFWYQMLQSVNYIHQNGVIHSDLKPANFLMVNGRLKLIDFGIASNISIDSTSIIKFSQAGTFNYISPEALIDTSTGNSPAGKNQPKIKISKKSDVWSLGCILYLLLYKKTPFGHIKNIYAKVNAISNPSTEIEYPELSIYYPPVLVEMTKSCLQHNAKRRPSVCDLLKYEFDMLIPLSSNQ